MNHYFRATIDFTSFDEKITKTLLREKGGRLVDEQLGRRLFDEIQAGRVEIDGISDIEDHGDQDEPGLRP